MVHSEAYVTRKLVAYTSDAIQFRKNAVLLPAAGLPKRILLTFKRCLEGMSIFKINLDFCNAKRATCVTARGEHLKPEAKYIVCGDRKASLKARF